MTRESTTVSGVLNLAEAMQNLDGDVELLAEIVEIFRETGQQQLQELAECVERGDIADVAVKAHGMKGGASNFRADRFIAAARELEQLAKSGTLVGAASLLDQLHRRFAELEEVIQVINWDEVAREWST